MSNKEQALARLKYRIEALAARFDSASDDDATEVAKKLNIYGRLAEVLRNEIAVDNAEANKPAQDAPKPYVNPVPPAPNPYTYGIRYGNDAGEPINW